MNAYAMQVRVLDRQQVVFSCDFSDPVELGRQNDAGEELYSSRPLEGGTWRAVIARLDENTLSRRHALLEPLADGRVRLTNLSGKVPIFLGDGGELAAGASCELALPALLAVGRKTVRLQAAGQCELAAEASCALALPGQVELAASRFPTLLVSEQARKKRYEELKKLFDPAETKRRIEAEQGKGCTTAELLEYLKSLETSG